MKWVTAGLVASVLGWLWWQHRRGRSELRAARELAEELDRRKM